MEQFIIDYRKKLERLEKEDGITRIPRLAVNPVDGSSYQKFVKTDRVRNNVDVTRYINKDTYLISDIHFGKKEEKDEKNIALLRKIPRDATLLILGDVGYGWTPCKDRVVECFKQFKVDNMFMVLGNHDCYELDFYYDQLGFKGVYEYIYIPEKNYTFTHQPADGPNPGFINFHGHIHNDTMYEIGGVTDVRWKINVWEGYCRTHVKTLKEWFDENYKRPLNKILVV